MNYDVGVSIVVDVRASDAYTDGPRVYGRRCDSSIELPRVVDCETSILGFMPDARNRPVSNGDHNVT